MNQDKLNRNAAIGAHATPAELTVYGGANGGSKSVVQDIHRRLAEPDTADAIARTFDAVFVDEAGAVTGVEYKGLDFELTYGGRKLDDLELLSMRLGAGQVPMRNKQGIFKPRKLCVQLALAFGSPIPPALCVRFDKLGHKTTFPMPLVPV